VFDIKSPCIKVCTLIDRVCTGCGRTLHEIAEWSSATKERKREILNRINNDRFEKI